MPRVGLFIPCYIDQFYPRVGMATVELLERYGAEVAFPEAQTCCGQPMANTGCSDQARPLARRFVEIFAPYEYVVCPSGSCVSMVRNHYHEYFEHEHCEHAAAEKYESLRPRVYELCQFLTEILGVERIDGSFPHRVGLHQSCHGLRELRLASSSEIVGPQHNRTRQLLESISGLQVTDLKRPDECCGFGGTFAVAEEAVSCMMGLDRLADHEQAGTEVLTGNDMSCLMHLEGLIRRQHKPMRVMHVVEILAGDSL